MPGRQLTITLYLRVAQATPLIFGNVFEWERADAITGRNVAVPQKLPRPNCSWMTPYSETAGRAGLPAGWLPIIPINARADRAPRLAGRGALDGLASSRFS